MSTVVPNSEPRMATKPPTPSSRVAQAVRLEEVGVGTARAWLAMQTAYNLAAQRAEGAPKVRKLDLGATRPSGSTQSVGSS
jgi:hypothetical protein